MHYEIVLDHGETMNKCTVTPLADRPDFHFFPVFGEGKIGPLSAPILLHHEGTCLTELRGQFPTPPDLACVDCVWRRVPKIIRKLDWKTGAVRRAKVPLGFVTAYPRVGRPDQDPDGGLATIEAIFTAAALLGNWDVSLLGRYFQGRKFVELNAARFQELGVPDARDPALWPVPPPLVRHALNRRRNRGRLPPTSITSRR